nr:SAM-dependent methyltransferase [Thermoanaerobacterium sp. RBIITD]
MRWKKVVGIGPGSIDDMTFRAYNVIKECDVVVGYITYINLMKEIINDKEIISSGMRNEISRCKECLKIALEGKKFV